MIKKRGFRKLTAMLMSVIFLVGMTPVSAIGEKSELPSGASGEIIAFEKLAAELGEQRVLLGSLETDLVLPETLMATIEFKVSEGEILLGSGERSPELELEETESDTLLDKEEDDTEKEVHTEAEVDGDTEVNGDTEVDGDIEVETERDKSLGEDENELGRITIPLPVRWASSPAYDGEKAGEYMFRPEVPESFILTEDIDIPQIKVIVDKEETVPRIVKEFTLLSTESGEAKVAGLGTEDNPLRIETAEHLAFFAWCWKNGKLPTSLPANPHLLLENDLDLSAYGKDYDGGKGWIPIGTDSRRFKGTFDGNNKTITGLYINRSEESYIGLFGRISNSTVKNIFIEGAVIYGSYSVGSVVGDSSGTESSVENCVSSATVSGSSSVGGIAGEASNIKNCVSTGAVSGVINVGGIVGEVQHGGLNTFISFSIQNCVSSSMVTGGDNVGGITGGGAHYGLLNCISSGEVSGVSWVGGIAGSAIGVPIQNCISSGGVSGYLFVGGIAGSYVGGLSGDVLVSINNCVALNSFIGYSTGSIGDEEYAGRIVGAHSGKDALVNNYAYSKMKVNGGIIESGAGAHNNIHGESVGFDDIETLWTTGGLSESWNEDGAWTLTEGKLPVLKDLPNQSNLLPVYIAGPAGFAGSGTEDDPYRIYTASDLNKLADLVNDGIGHGGFFRLENDTDLSIYGKDYDGGKGWTAIGSSESPFQGIFDGNNKKITGLYINRVQDNVGLFGYINHHGTVKNVVLVGGNVSGMNNVGGVAGYVSSPVFNIENCINTGSISGSENIGGVVGYVIGVTVKENCINTGSISGKENVGGVVGYTAEHTSAKDCNNRGSISGVNHVGGVIGHSLGGSIKKCINKGSIRAEGDQVGGVVGFNQAEVNACINKGNIRANEQVGGVVGANNGVVYNSINTGSVDAKVQVGGIAGQNIYIVSKCVNTGSIIGQKQIGGIAGKDGDISGIENCATLNRNLIGEDDLGRIVGLRGNHSNYLDNNYAFANMIINEEDLSDGAADDKNGASVGIDDIKTLWTTGGLNESWNSWDSVWTLVEGKLPVLKDIPDQSDSLPAHIVGIEGSGTEGDPYRIYSAETMKYMADRVNSDIHSQYADKHFRLENNIDLSVYEYYDEEKGWTPIGSSQYPFKGYFDGNNKTITGLYINCTDNDYVGLFGYVENGIVKNLTFEGASINGKSYVGALAGYVENGTVDNFVNTGTISGTGIYVGGVVGYVHCGKVKNCISTGNIAGNNTHVGGVVGYAEGGTVENCISSGNITGNNTYVGSMVGYVHSSTVEYCISIGSVSGSNSYAGGVVGYVHSSTVENCISTGNISGNNTHVGGVIGYVEDGTVGYCVALSFSINGKTCGRVTSETKGNLSNNFAFSGMKVNGTTVSGTHDDLNGANTNITSLLKGSFWSETVKWDESVWSIGDNRLPYLKALPHYAPRLNSNAYTLPMPDSGDIVLTAVPNAMAKSAETQTVILIATGDFQNTMWPELTWETNEGSLHIYGDTFGSELTVPADFTGKITVTVKLKSFPYLPGKSVTVQVNGDLAGTVTVDGTYRIGQTLTANIRDISENPGALSYQWMRRDEPIIGATNESYVLKEEDFNHIVSVCITAKYYLDKIQSEGQTVLRCVNSTTPVTPKLVSKTQTSITLATVTGYEYALLSANGDTAQLALAGAFQPNPVFEGLNSGTSYDLYQRIAQTDLVEASTFSEKLVVITKHIPSEGGGSSNTPTTPVARIKSGGSITGTNLDQLISKGNTLTVDGDSGAKLVFDADALKGIDRQTSGDIKVEIKDLSAEHQDAHEGKLVYSLTVSSGRDTISNFGGRVTVYLPYELKEGESARDVTVWHLASDGTMTRIPCTYNPATKLATFMVTHFSLYVVGVGGAGPWINPFSDVRESDWFYGTVEFANRNGLFAGTSADTFSPNSPMTRNMLWTVLGRLDGQSFSSSGVYDTARSWAIGIGITDGTNPNGNITREQMVTILWRFAGSPKAGGNLSKFSDAGSVASYAADAMTWAVEKGIVAGANGALMPQGNATRAQVAVILQRFIEGMAN